MNPPNPLAFRHSSAQAGPRIQFGFAPTRAAGQSGRAGQRLPWPGLHSHTCYPSLTLRSGPSQTGAHPFHNRRVNADCVKVTTFRFESLWFLVDSLPIKTTNRGSQTCIKPSSSSLFSPCRCRPACRTLLRAGLPALPRARWSPMRLMKTWSPVPRLGRWPVQPPAASNWACRPASRATDVIAAFGRVDPNHGVVRAHRPVGPFCILAPSAD